MEPLNPDYLQVEVNFSPSTLNLLNLILAVVMFGIALSLRPADFRRLYEMPRSVFAGLLSQWLLLPILTFFLVILLEPHPSIALGMLLVACCPGGSVSNFLTQQAEGDTALSVTLTAFSSIGALLITPFGFQLMVNLLAIDKWRVSDLGVQISVSRWDMAQTVLIVLIIPLIVGMLVRARADRLANLLEKPLKWFSFLFLIAFIIFSSVKYFPAFRLYLAEAGWMVLIHNGLALFIGYSTGKFLGLRESQRRTLSIETGIQNTGLGLVIIFTFFDGLTGMALVAAWYGVWHIAAGILIAWAFRRRPSSLQQELYSAN